MRLKCTITSETNPLYYNNKKLRGQKKILEDNVVNEGAKDLKLKKNCNKPSPDQKSPVGMTRTDLKICSEKSPK